MLKLIELTYHLRQWPVWSRYVSVALIVLVAFAGMQLLELPQAGFPFLLFYLAIVLSACIFDRGTGYFATALATALAAYVFVEPIGRIGVSDPTSLLALIMFFAIGVTSTLVVEALHLALRRLREAHERAARAEHDKDVLLHEFGHRVRNDLANLAGMLHLQARRLQGDRAEPLRAAADRIQVMARIHSRLSRRGEEAVIDTQRFLGDLCDDLRIALIGLRPIKLRAEIESVQLLHARAVPLGLILNELLTNAIKYAFPGDRAGTITVTFRRAGDAGELTVVDNGVGIDPKRQPHGTGLGQRLVRSLAKQLSGEFGCTARQPGTACALRFPLA